MNHNRFGIGLAVAWEIISLSQHGWAQPDTPAKSPNASRALTGKKAGEVRDDNGLMLKLLWCPPGKFKMGSPEAEQDRLPNEGAVEVTLTKGFWLGQTEVTQGQWEKVMGATPWKGETLVKEGASCAATYVSWEDAAEFCRKLTGEERKARRLPNEWEYALPTEAQWEHACRAGTTTRFSFGDDDSQLGDYAWWGGAGFAAEGSIKTEKYAHPVGLKKANPWGFYDMHGNVWEFCLDFQDDKLPGGNDPLGPANGERRMIRGGGWQDSPGGCRSAMRIGADVNLRFNFVSFRVACIPCGSR
jgi:formylglycine-generating enzyme required for sulfatase activity